MKTTAWMTAGCAIGGFYQLFDGLAVNSQATTIFQQMAGRMQIGFGVLILAVVFGTLSIVRSIAATDPAPPTPTSDTRREPYIPPIAR